ncbi:MAG: DUF2771 family protein [Actinobacteria bacterium]|nr:DUF2771 family protein [Actinomycetota bacterium]MCA1720206.1 DUF2771 family protein [Actinomycetota bacterium]
MTARSRLVAGLSTAICVVALTGCQQPTPLVSMVSSGNTVHTEATIYCFDGQSAAEQNCRTAQDTAPTVLKVKPGQQVGIDVAKDVADSGWVVVLPGDDEDPANDQASGAQDSHYFAFTPQFERGPLKIEVRMLDHGDTKAPTIGNWQFVLVPDA